jgi:hypothetical protein
MSGMRSLIGISCSIFVITTAFHWHHDSVTSMSSYELDIYSNIKTLIAKWTATSDA